MLLHGFCVRIVSGWRDDWQAIWAGWARFDPDSSRQTSTLSPSFLSCKGIWATTDYNIWIKDACTTWRHSSTWSWAAIGSILYLRNSSSDFQLSNSCKLSDFWTGSHGPDAGRAQQRKIWFIWCLMSRFFPVSLLMTVNSIGIDWTRSKVWHLMAFCRWLPFASDETRSTNYLMALSSDSLPYSNCNFSFLILAKVVSLRHTRHTQYEQKNMLTIFFFCFKGNWISTTSRQWPKLGSTAWTRCSSWAWATTTSPSWTRTPGSFANRCGSCKWQSDQRRQQIFLFFLFYPLLSFFSFTCFSLKNCLIKAMVATRADTWLGVCWTCTVHTQTRTCFANSAISDDE